MTLEKPSLSCHDISPVMELPSRIGWKFHYSEIIFDDPPYLIMEAWPDFSGCHPDIGRTGIVWDPLLLWKSIIRPGGYFLLTCSCDYPPDAGIEEMVLVSHPDDRTVIWELDIKGLFPALDKRIFPDEGFVRLVFNRDDYETEIKSMLHELRHRLVNPAPIAELSDVNGFDHLIRLHPQLAAIAVGEFEPNGGCDEMDTLLGMDPEAARSMQPIWPPGTVIEFGFFDRGGARCQEVMIVDGLPLPGANWPTRYLTRWSTLIAFCSWMAYVQRGHAMSASWVELGGQFNNTFFLTKGSDRERCHEAGKVLASLLQKSYEESNAAQGVTVAYRKCYLPAIDEMMPARASQGE